MIRTMIVDDHPWVRSAVAATLGGARDISVVGVYGGPLEAIAAVDAIQPDVVVMDINMPALNGFEAAAEMVARSRPPRIVMITGSASPDGPASAAAVGAVGYVLKGDCPALVRAVRAVFAGETAWPAGAAVRA